jgi:uncharacterized protein YxjI
VNNDARSVRLSVAAGRLPATECGKSWSLSAMISGSRTRLGQRVFKVDGKMLRVRDTLFFEDMQGQTLCKIQEKLLRIKDTMTIEGPNDEPLATVRKALIAPLRHRFTVKIGDGPDLDVQGNILSLEYTIGEGGNKIAEVSRKWFRIADTYGVQIEPGQNDIMILAVTVAIDMMAHG